MDNQPTKPPSAVPLINPSPAATVTSTSEEQKSPKKWLLLIIMLVILLILAIGSYFLYKNSLSNPAISTPQNTIQPQSTSSDVNTWQTFTGANGSYSFKYPSNWENQQTNLLSGNSNSESVAFYGKPKPPLDPSKAEQSLKQLAADTPLLFQRSDATASAQTNLGKYLQDQLGTKFISSESASINSLNIIKMHYNKCDINNFQNECISYNFIKNSSIFTFISTPSLSDQSIIEKIIGTFKSN